MANGLVTPASDAHSAPAMQFELSDEERAFLLRLRNLRKQAGDGLYRIELHVNRSRVELIDARPVKREVFA